MVEGGGRERRGDYISTRSQKVSLITKTRRKEKKRNASWYTVYY
jgi:hypothetical protein